VNFVALLDQGLDTEKRVQAPLGRTAFERRLSCAVVLLAAIVVAVMVDVS
jgi:hypothetical protein